MDSAPSSVIQEDSQGFSKTCRNQTQVSPEQVADGNAGKDAFSTCLPTAMNAAS